MQGIDPSSVDFSWDEDRAVVTVGTNLSGNTSTEVSDDQASGAAPQDEQMQCIEAVLNG